jgi:hypothetical protein
MFSTLKRWIAWLIAWFKSYFKGDTVMSALSIEVPFPVFQDRNGQPLDNGYVWIGVADLNPQTNPVAVYFDSELTVPATQPLRTVNGYIASAGSPAQVYIDGNNFSILVQDSTGSMIYNFPQGTGIAPVPNNASGIEYDPAGAGAVATTVQTKLRETVSVKDFGAVGDGVTDDTAAIQTALNSGQPCISIPMGSVCLFSSNLTLPSNVTLLGPGALKASTTAVSLVLSNNNSVVDGVEFVGEVDDVLYDIAINGLTSYFSNASLVTGGGALSSVGGVSGNNLTLGFVTDSGDVTTEVFSSLIPIDIASRYVVQIEEGFVESGYVVGAMKIRAFDSSGVPIVGNSSISVDASGYYNYILPTTYTLGNYLFLDNASFVQFSFAVQRDANQRTGNTVVYDMSKVKFLQLINYLASSPKTSLDISANITITGTNSVVKNCYFHNLANSSIGGLSPNNALIVDNICYNCLAGIALNTTTNTVISNNKIIADFNGYGNRAYRWKSIAGINNTNLTVDNNTAKGNFWGFEIIEQSTGLLYKGCSFTNNYVDSISGAMSLAGYDGAVISGNTCITQDISRYGIEFPQNNFNCEISNNTISANTEMMQSVGISGVGGTNPESGTIVTNNQIKAAIGITCVPAAPATAASSFNLVVVNNTIKYGTTAIFCTIGDINFSNNTVDPINKGSNQIFGRRAALQIGGGGLTIQTTSYVAQNVINANDCYAIYGQFTRLINIENNSIFQTNSVSPPIFYENFAVAPTKPNVLNNSITTAYSGQYIEFAGTPFAGSFYNIYGNTGGTAKINVNNLPLSSSLINTGPDSLVYEGTVTPSAGTFSKTVDVVKAGNYWLSTYVQNGDNNHVQFSFQKQMRIVASTNTLQILTSIQTGSSGSLLTGLTVDTSSGDIVFSGTNLAGLDGIAIPYKVTMSLAEF